MPRKKKLTAKQKKKREEKRKWRAAKREAAGDKPRRPKPFTLEPGNLLKGLDLSRPEDPFWDEFERRDLDGRFAYFEEKLGGEDIEDYAFDMLDQMYVACVSPEERERFLKLLDRVKDERPKLYRSEAPYLLEWKASCGLALGQPELVAEAARAFAEHGEQIDLFNQMLDKLAFIGELDLLLEVRRRAWDDIADSDKIIDGGASYLKETIDLELLSFALKNPDPATELTDLLAHLDTYAEGIRKEGLCERLPFMRGLTGEISAADLAKKPGSKNAAQAREAAEEERLRRVLHLSLLFLHELLAAKLMPPSRAELGRWVLLDAVFAHAAGNLAPTAKELDRFLSRYFDFILPRPSRCVAFLELYPHWLRFLARHGVISTKTVKKRLASLKGLIASVKDMVSSFSLPLLEETLGAWPGQVDSE